MRIKLVRHKHKDAVFTFTYRVYAAGRYYGQIEYKLYGHYGGWRIIKVQPHSKRNATHLVYPFKMYAAKQLVYGSPFR